MSSPDKPTRQGTPASDTDAATPERAPDESNYGYQSDHPSYKLRGAGDWSPRFGEHQDYRPNASKRPRTPEPSQHEERDEVDKRKNLDDES